MIRRDRRPTVLGDRTALAAVPLRHKQRPQAELMKIRFALIGILVRFVIGALLGFFFFGLFLGSFFYRHRSGGYVQYDQSEMVFCLVVGALAGGVLMVLYGDEL